MALDMGRTISATPLCIAVRHNGQPLQIAEQHLQKKHKNGIDRTGHYYKAARDTRRKTYSKCAFLPTHLTLLSTLSRYNVRVNIARVALGNHSTDHDSRTITAL